MKTATGMLKEKLIEIGADGLCDQGFSCGCTIDDFVLCGRVFRSCVPGKNNPKKAVEMECDFWMEPMED